MPSFNERLQEILLERGIVTPEQMEEVLQHQRRFNCSFKEAFCRSTILTEKELMAVIAEELNTPLIDLSKLKIDPAIANILPEEIVRKYQVVPIAKMGGSLTVAMSDPLNIFALDDIAAMTKMRPTPVIATQADINTAIDQLYTLPANEAIEKIVENIRESELELIAMAEAPDTEILFKDITQEPIVKLAAKILENAILQRASDVLIEPLDRETRIRYRIDGILYEHRTLARTIHDALVSRFKVMSELDIAERRLPQEGRFKARFLEREVDCRVSVLPSIKGENMAIRLLDKTVATLDIEKLGFGEHNIAVLKDCVDRPHGMILVCGPTGSGKTTTLYSLLKIVNSPEINVVTVEEPVEYQLEGVNQSSINTDIGYTYARALRSILRQDPEIIMVGEIRDFETVDIAIKAALTGHLVLSTLHTTTAPGSITRLINMGVDTFLINATVTAIVAQRLLRELCPHCKTPYTPRGAILEKFKVATGERTEELNFFHPKGCSRCFHSGYFGRIGIAEILVLTPSIREVISRKPQELEIKRIARKEGMMTLREAAIRHVINGVTSLEEALRLTAPDEQQ
ncbi:MAG: Flp pilus assembly complex ATPase component TadA [Candidatus Omnitrophica bacterium]|nr:Flp pilus assembly complex ATPase component TadA [Candidatus Omnitrophota bacterium]